MPDTKAVFKRAIKLSKPPQGDIIELGRCLARLNQQPGELRRFLETSGMGSRKAYYLIGISELFDPLGLPEARLNRIGWTKLQVIGEHIEKQRQAGERVSASQARDLLNEAEQTTTQQLKARLRGEPQEKTHCVLMYFSPEQYGLFEDAVLAHGGERSGRGLLHREEAVISIIRQLQGEQPAERKARPRRSRSQAARRSRY